MFNNTALLSAVTWPDIDKDMYPRWNRGDTLPEFTPLKTSYLVELRFDATQIPAFQFVPQDLRSKIEVVNATNINGNAEQRTTSVTVTSESDTIINTYHFTFQKQGTPIQPYIAEPFISEYVHGITTQGWAVEIFNPGTDDLDLSRYMYVSGAPSQTWQEAIATSRPTYWAGNRNDGIVIYQTHYIPSKRWKNDTSEEAWFATPSEEDPFAGPGFFRDDNQTDPWVKGGDVFVMGIGLNTNDFQTKIRQEADFIFRGTDADGTTFAWDSTKILHRETPIWNNPGHNMWLLKVLNDSILEGTKDCRLDPLDYELIDRWEIIGDSLAGRADVKGMNWTMKRKSSVIKGNLERMGGGNETAESSEWEIHKTTDFDFNNSMAVANLGIHTMDPVTNYLSTVTSVKLKVTPGYQGDNLSITGNIADYTPTSIAMVLDKADDSQTFKFMRGDAELAPDASLADADILEVTSGDGVNVTNYKLVNAPLDNNTTLTAVDGSGLIISGDMISGVTVDMTLKDVLANLQAGDKAIVNVLNANGALQPLSTLGLDSMVYDVMASDQIVIQVVAENDDKMTYGLDLGFTSSDAVLWSNILRIDQDTKLIKEYPNNLTAPGFLAMVYANEGATVNVIDKGGFERMTGFMSIDDRIVVTAADGVTKVIYRFSEDLTVSVKPVTEDFSDVVIFPNPVTNILNIKGLELATVQVYSLSGSIMIHETASYSNRLNVSNLPDGIYIIKMTDIKGRTVVDKFLKR